MHQRPGQRGRALRAALFVAFLLGATPGLACVEHPQEKPGVRKVANQPPQRGGSARIGINQRARCTITRISDGDSVVCEPLGRVRLLLIDAPELSEGKLGREARDEVVEMMPVGTQVIAETDVSVTDQYGRVLAYLFLPSGAMVNELMAAAGYVTTLVYPPNVKYVERIRAAVASARRARRGLWAEGGFDCAPRDYRAGRCR